MDEITLDELPNWFTAMANRLDTVDFTEPLKESRGLIIADTRNNFITESDPDGELWTPLNPLYAIEKQKMVQTMARPYFPGFEGILILSGALFTSVTGGETEHTIDTMNYRSLELGTTLPYAVFHQYGFGRIPARPFMGISQDLGDRIANLFANHVITVFMEPFTP